MLDVGHPGQRRLPGGSHPQGMGLEGPRDPADDDCVLLPVLVALEQLLAQVGVDRRVRAAASRAGEADGAGPLTLSTHQQLWAGRHEGGVSSSHRKHVTARERRPEEAEHRGRVVVDRRVNVDFAGQDDLGQLTAPNPLDGSGHGLLVMRRRDRADHGVGAGGGRIDQRQRGRAQLPQAPAHPRPQVVDRIVGRGLNVDGDRHAVVEPSQ